MLELIFFWFRFELSSIGLLLCCLKIIGFVEEEYNWRGRVDDFILLLLFLIVVLYIILLVIGIKYKIRISLLFFFMYFCVKSRSLFVFFFIYEIIFILIIFSLIFLGYRLERLMASFLIIIYSFIFSRPVIIVCLLLDYGFIIKEWLLLSNFLIYFLVGAFMVKFPIFGFHYWLPIAHVEASTVGSILLAGLLLKIGCLGVYYLVVYLKFMVKFFWLSFGVIIVMVMVLGLRDLKIMIAYSSVAHIRIVFYVIILGSFIGKKGGLIIIFCHGYISPLMFWLVGIVGWWKSRSIMVLKLISFSYFNLFIIFLLFLMNIGFPPFISFLSEVYIYKARIIYFYTFYVLILGVVLSCYYNIYLFWCFVFGCEVVFKMSVNGLELFFFLILVLWLW